MRVGGHASLIILGSSRELQRALIEFMGIDNQSLLTRLIRELVRLPGIGQKTAQRLAFHLLKAEQDEALRLAEAIRAVKEGLSFCRQCRNIAEHELFAHLVASAQPAARRARTERRVEREVPRLELGHRDAARGTAVALGEQDGCALRSVVPNDLDEAVGQLERRLQRIVQPTAVLRAHDEAVHDDGHVVILPLVELRRIRELRDRSIDDGPDEPLLAR